MWKKLSNFQQRAIFGMLATIIGFSSILLSHITPFNWVFFAIILTTQSVALWELYKLAFIRGFEPLTTLGLCFSALYMTLHFVTLSFGYSKAALLALTLVYLFGIGCFIASFKHYFNAIANIATTLFGFIYITFPLSLFFDIAFNFGKFVPKANPLWLFYLILATKMTDTCAYITGKLFGRKKFAPILSPKKTIEGVIGGLIGATGVSIAFVYVLRLMQVPLNPSVTYSEIGMLGFAIGTASILGDLAESLLKRDAGVKDSNDLPGFGGVLDMVDSLVFTTPLLYLYLRAKMPL